ncbi:MAG: dihydropteroate synthase [Phycisphaeraceae bacterium]|nr:dihydropteroate synthase [Phycisphaeraceae bacterium]MCB9847829.1 dihydropteroate synthase [Phycisphaeraceae bacterium]
MSERASPASTWRVSIDRALTLDRARVLAILNITPDSFSDGGRFAGADDAVRAARAAIDAGADMLDIGGESTRPGSAPVGPGEQIARVVPVIAEIRRAGIRCPISVDTTSSRVALAALHAGADAVNDVSAGTDDDAMLPMIAGEGAGVILMHRLRKPAEDSRSDRYERSPVYEGGVVEGVRHFLESRVGAAMAAGIDRDAIAIDPGLGFGKSVAQNYELIAATRRFVGTGLPVVGAASRKSFLGVVTGIENPADRVSASVAASVAQRLRGASLFRVHDVREHVEALRVTDAILSGAPPDPA